MNQLKQTQTESITGQSVSLDFLSEKPPASLHPKVPLLKILKKIISILIIGTWILICGEVFLRVISTIVPIYNNSGRKLLTLFSNHKQIPIFLFEISFFLCFL